MGHLVNGERKQRGEGFELRTDKWGAIRAGKGLFISAEERIKASSTQLDMTEAISQLQAAQSLVASMKDAAEMAKAELADLQTQKKLLKESIKGLKQSAILMSAPAGIVQTTPASIQLSAGQNVITTAVGNHDTNVIGKLTAAAAQSISLFAQKMGIKLFASRGKVELQAQGDEMTLDAFKDITIKSSTGKVLIAAKQEIILNAGQDYIRIGHGQVEIGSGKRILFRTGKVKKTGSASMTSPFKTWQEINAQYHHYYEFRDYTDQPQINKEFIIKNAENKIFATGRTDGNGRTPIYHFDEPTLLKAHLKDEKDNI